MVYERSSSPVPGRYPESVHIYAESDDEAGGLEILMFRLASNDGRRRWCTVGYFGEC